MTDQIHYTAGISQKIKEVSGFQQMREKAAV